MYTKPDISVLVADDHDIYRDGLRMMMEKQPSVKWVGEASNGREVVELAADLEPDVVLMDIQMPVMDGIKATKLLQDSNPGIHVIALSMSNEDNLIVDMFEAGAKGFLLKNADKKEIVESIHSVYEHVPYYCKSTSSKLARLLGNSRFNPFNSGKDIRFSEKEMEIMRLVCQEFTNKEIGEKLFLSPRTVEGHRLRIQEKLNVKSTVGIVIYAIRMGIYKPV